MTTGGVLAVYQEILDFWFREISPADWWTKSEAFDRLLKQRFLNVLEQASRCELYEWRKTPGGRLAEIILLDQFSRNIYRDTPRAFAQDAQALALAQEVIAAGIHQSLSAIERNFLYMPYMHSESLIIHEQAVILFTENGLVDNLDFELRHKAIIERFGRYPHRNNILGRISTPEEIEFLSQPGSSF